MSEDMQAHWAIEQLMNAARHLGVYEFVNQQKSMPEVKPLEEYYRSHFSHHVKIVERMSSVIERKVNMVERDTKTYNRVYGIPDLDWDEKVEGVSKYGMLVRLDEELRKQEEEIIKLWAQLEEIHVLLRRSIGMMICLLFLISKTPLII
jgi:ribonucleotide reductase alpha subunit